MTRVRRVGRAIAVATMIAATCGLAACSSPTPKVSGVPSIVMSSATRGYAAWPSGARWIVISTTDGWKHVQNRTPLGVPTDGGLVVAADGNQVRVGVLPFHLLKTSPVMVSSNGGVDYTSTQLGAALTDASGALSVAGSTSFGVDHSGAIFELPTSASAWTQLPTRPSAASGSPKFRPTSVSSPDSGSTLYAVGANTSDVYVAYSSTDHGLTWTPEVLPGTQPSQARAFPPCRSGSVTLLPVIVGSDVLGERSPGAHAWTAAAAPSGPGTPVVTCGGGQIWLFRVTSSGSEIFTLGATGGWQHQGHIAQQVRSATTATMGESFVSTTSTKSITRVTLAPNLLATDLPLPSWVATIGGSKMSD